ALCRTTHDSLSRINSFALICARWLIAPLGPNHSATSAVNNVQCGYTSTANIRQIGNNVGWALHLHCSVTIVPVSNVLCGGQVALCRYHRSRGRDAIGELR